MSSSDTSNASVWSSLSVDDLENLLKVLEICPFRPLSEKEASVAVRLHYLISLLYRSTVQNKDKAATKEDVKEND